MSNALGTAPLSAAQLRELPAGTIIARDAVREVWESRQLDGLGREAWNTGRTEVETTLYALGRRNPKTRALEPVNRPGFGIAYGCRTAYTNAARYYLAA
jgi:hypothetical protein